MKDVKYASMNFCQSLAIKNNGDLYIWGKTDPTSENANLPKKIMENVVEAEFNTGGGIALTTDGNVWTWGDDQIEGILGNGRKNESVKCDDPINVFNIYTGVCNGTHYSEFYKPVSFNYNENVYDRDFATENALYAMLAYDNYRVMLLEYYDSGSRLNYPKTLISQMRKDGYKDICPSSSYRDTNMDNISFTFGAREVIQNGVNRTQILICIRGTDGCEWNGNMQLTGTKFNEDEKDTHYSFRRGKIYIENQIYDYEKKLKSYGYDVSNPIFVINGHSRGAAVANLLAADLTDIKNGKSIQDAKSFKNINKTNVGQVFCYTYATPNATTLYNKKIYTNIFNHKFKDDFVPNVPLEKWGYGSYGIPYLSVAEDNYKLDNFKQNMKTFAKLCGESPNLIGFNKKDTPKLINHVGKYWPKINQFYTKRADKETEKNKVSLYDFFFDGIANLAQSKLSYIKQASAMAKVYTPLDQPLYFFIKDGNPINPDINYNHQSYTYYLATRLGLFKVDSSINTDTSICSDSSIIVDYNGSVSNNALSENGIPVNDPGSSVSNNELIDDNEALTVEQEKQTITNLINSNQSLVELGWDPENPTTWNGIVFDKDGYVNRADLSYSDLEGTLDLSGFNHLTQLDCSGNNLEKITLNHCTNLSNLSCYYNNSLDSLLIENCVSLKELDCSGGSIQTINLNDSTSLVSLVCGDNQLTELDLSDLKQLEEVDCNNNNISTLV